MLSIKPNHTKRLGQHFLHDKNYVQRIILEAGIRTDDCLIEIGPGGGALTENLLPCVDQLTAIEIDPILCNALKEKFFNWQERFRLYHADALKIDCAFLGCVTPKKVRLVGNLPYNVATPLLFHWLKDRHFIRDFHVMLQKEVVDRFVAKPGSKIYGRLSVMMQYYCELKSLFKVPPGAFFPAPQVDSAVLKIVPFLSMPWIAKDEFLFAQIVKAAFSQRRKMLTNSLRALGISSSVLRASQLDPHARAEALSVADYVRLSNQCTFLKEQ